jgi:regulator of ribonuclease activity A
MMTAEFRTTDLCDAHEGAVQACEPMFRSYGGRSRFAGPVVTISCFEDNSRIRDAVNEPGEGRVLVVDGGGSRSCALLGDLLAARAVESGWAGVIVHGCVRDTAVLASLDLGVLALAAHPCRSKKRGEGHRDVTVRFAGVSFHPGAWVYADEDGLLVAAGPLDGGTPD